MLLAWYCCNSTKIISTCCEFVKLYRTNCRGLFFCDIMQIAVEILIWCDHLERFVPVWFVIAEKVKAMQLTRWVAFCYSLTVLWHQVTVHLVDCFKLVEFVMEPLGCNSGRKKSRWKSSHRCHGLSYDEYGCGTAYFRSKFRLCWRAWSQHGWKDCYDTCSHTSKIMF